MTEASVGSDRTVSIVYTLCTEGSRTHLLPVWLAQRLAVVCWRPASMLRWISLVGAR